MNANKMKQRAQLSAALKILDRGPKIISDAIAQYAAADAEISSRRDLYSKNYAQQLRNEAAQKRDATVRAQHDRMVEALEYVQHQREKTEGIDITSPELQNAIRIIDAAKGGLSPADQIAVMTSFRGSNAEINFISNLFKQYDLWYSGKGLNSYDLAADLTKPISEEALNNMIEYLAFTNFDPSTDFAEKIRFTRHAFEDYAVRQGLTEDQDAMVQALRDLKRSATSEEDHKTLAYGIYEMQQLPSDSTLAEKSAVFDRTVRELGKASKNQLLQEKYEAAQYRAENRLGREVTIPSPEEAEAALFGTQPDTSATDEAILSAARRSGGLGDGLE